MSAPIYATGRRKTAIARVWLFPNQKGISVNGREFAAYLDRQDLQIRVQQPLQETQTADRFRVRARVVGGGIVGQADAIRLGIARALVKSDEKLRAALRRGGFLTRDPREKERKKYGRKGARRSFQYTKR